MWHTDSHSARLEFEGEYELLDYHAKQQGTIKASFVPCTADGQPFDDDHYIEDPSELLGKPFYLKVSTPMPRWVWWLTQAIAHR